MTDATELEDLETLISCPGWKRVEQRFQQEWGRSGTRYIDILERMANNAGDVQEELKRVIWVRKEMEAFMNGVLGRVVELRNKKAPAMPASRRGVL